jgi:hypothetical protein
MLNKCKLYGMRCLRDRIVVACAIGCLITANAGCALVVTEVVPRAVNGKGLVEDGVDMATGEDCRVIEGTFRKDRQICETRDSPATKKDFKGLSGIGDDEPASKAH